MLGISTLFVPIQVSLMGRLPAAALRAAAGSAIAMRVSEVDKSVIFSD